MGGASQVIGAEPIIKLDLLHFKTDATRKTGQTQELLYAHFNFLIENPGARFARKQICICITFLLHYHGAPTANRPEIK